MVKTYKQKVAGLNPGARYLSVSVTIYLTEERNKGGQMGHTPTEKV